MIVFCWWELYRDLTPQEDHFRESEGNGARKEASNLGVDDFLTDENL